MLTSRFFPSFVVASSLLLLPAVLPAKDRITIFYDAFSDSKEITKDWGFSALIEHDGKRLLFDTGNDAATFEHNTRAVGIDLTKLAFVVISHRHTDHTTGLKYLLSINPNVPVYAPMEAFCMFGGSVPPTLIKPVASLPDRMRYYGEVSGQDRFRISLERRGLSLVFTGAHGLFLPVGCSPPGT